MSIGQSENIRMTRHYFPLAQTPQKWTIFATYCSYAGSEVNASQRVVDVLVPLSDGQHPLRGVFIWCPLLHLQCLRDIALQANLGASRIAQVSTSHRAMSSTTWGHI
jgi:hypothetical protein